MPHTLRIGLVLFLLCVAAAPLQAANIVAGNTLLTGTAIQDFTLLANTPFNPTGSDILLDDLSGVGHITIQRGTQVGDTIPINSISGGMFFGSHPALGSYVFGNIPPLTGADFSGVITNVIQNPLDPGFATGQPSSFQSGDFSFGGASFGFQFLTGPAAGIVLFTETLVEFSFDSIFDGLPPSAGTVLTNSGTDVLNVLFNGQVVATSSDRRIVISAVPEPSSLLLLGIGATALGCLVRRKHT